MRPNVSLASSFGSSACGPIGLSCGAAGADYSASSIAALSGSLGACTGSSVLSAASMGLLARACSRGGVWLNGGRRVATTLTLVGTMAAGQAMARDYYDEIIPDDSSGRDTMVLTYGDSATRTIINNSGQQQIHENGSATSTTINRGGEQFIFFGGQATSTTINSGGSQHVLSSWPLMPGAVDTTINGGEQFITTGAFASGTTISSGLQHVFNSGSATSTAIHSGGSQLIDGLVASASDTTIYSGGNQIVSSGAATSTTIHSGGVQTLLSGRASFTFISGGSQIIKSGGSATTTFINGGVQHVSSGGKAIDTAINNGGTQIVDNNASAISANITSGGSQLIKNGGTATDTVISGGKQHVSRGATATSTTISNGGSQYVSSGGKVTSTTINSGGSQFVDSAVNAIDTTINDGGEQHVSSSGAKATSTTINSGGSQYISNGAMASSTTINNAGWQRVYSGASAINTIANGGNQYVYSGASATSTTIQNGGWQTISGGTVSATSLDHGTQAIHGGTAISTSITEHGMQEIYDGGHAIGTTVSGTSSMQAIMSGGQASGTIIQSEGGQAIFYGGEAIGTTIHNTGIQIVAVGATASLTTIHAGGMQELHGSASRTTISGGEQVVDGGTATSTTIHRGGKQHVFSSGTATSTTISSGGSQTVSSGGSATSTTIHSGGEQSVDGGGSATSTTIHSGGRQHVASGGTATDTTLKGGTMNVSAGGQLRGTLAGHGTVNNAAALIVDGGTSGLAALTATSATRGTSATGDTLTVSGAVEARGGNISAGQDATLDVRGALQGASASVGIGDGGTVRVGNVTADALAVEVANDDTGTLSATLNMPTALSKTGTGTLTLTQAQKHSYTGGAVVQAGTLELADTKAAGAGTVEVKSGAALRLSASGAYENALLQGTTNTTLEVVRNGAQVKSIEGFTDYLFDAAQLNTSTSMLKLTAQAANLLIDAASVHFDNSTGLGAKFGVAAPLLESNRPVTLSGSTSKFTAPLDHAIGGLPASVYDLIQRSSQQIDVSFDKHYLYGKGGGQFGTGQRPANNKLTLAGGIATAAFGGRASNGDVTGNTAEMSAGTLLKDSSNPLSGNLYGGYADNGNATDNTVVYTGGDVQGAIYGGYADGGTATKNTVALKGSFAGSIYGGNNAATGNTLAVQNKGLTVGNINNFENLYFILPDTTANGDTMLTVTDGTTQFAATMTNVGVGVAGGSNPLKEGEQVTLLTNPNGLRNAAGNELQAGTDYQLVTTGLQGFSLSHDFELSNDANSLNATVKTPPSPPPQPQPTPPQPKPQPQPEPEPVPPKPEPVPPKPEPVPPAPQVDPRTKAVPESRVAVMGMLNLGADQIARMTGNLPNRTGGGAPDFGSADGKGGANGAGAPNTQTPDGATVFAHLSGHRQKIETGSHVNVNGASAIIGAAKAVPLAGGGTAAVGAFFEYGDGSFKTHNDFDTGAVDGKGNSDYYGAGVLARVNLAGSENGAPFVEGSLHAGSIHNNWHTDDLRDAATGQRAQYDIRTPYMGAHVGAGYRWQTGEASSVEAYGQYLYTHMDGKDTNVALDPYHFNAVKSSRTRLGAKGTWAVSNTTSAYAGAAWEREFDGTARATAYSLDVPAPTMKGNSAVLDAGLSFQPKRNLSTNVGVTGYAGKRKGAAANVEVQYLF